jgi:hypothetical protein
MKKITLLITLMISSLGFAQPIVPAPTPPVRASSDVVSIFSGAYSNVSLAELPTTWSQLGTFSTIQVSGDDVWKMTACEFLGMVTNYATGTNLSTMEKMHIDYFTPDTNGISVKIVNTIDGGEAIQSLGTTVTGSWQSVDIDMSAFAVNKTKITQILIDPAGPNTLYIDNFYFYKTAVDPLKDATLSDLKVDGTTISSFASGIINYTYSVANGTVIVPQITAATTTNGSATTVITQASAIPGSATVVVTSADSSTTKTYTVSIVAVGPPTAAPTPPNRNPSDVISLYSGSYANVASNFDAGWCGGSSVQVVTIASNPTVAWKGNNCQGIVLDSGIDASSFTNLHVDVYIEAGTDLTSSVFNLKFVQQPGGAALEINLNVASTPALVAGSWLQIDVPVNLATFTGFKEFGITSNLNNKLWYDNLYAYKGTALGTAKFETSSVKMYPNPVKNTLTIDANSNINRVFVYNILGQEVLKASPKSNSVTLQTSELQKGVYMVTTEIDGKVSTSKVVKE